MVLELISKFKKIVLVQVEKQGEKQLYKTTGMNTFIYFFKNEEGEFNFK